MMNPTIMTTIMAEDCGAPELRNPLNSKMTSMSLFRRFFRMLSKGRRIH